VTNTLSETDLSATHRVVGVTGGIGAGKTTVLELLALAGLRTLDSDTVVHRLYLPGSAVAEELVRRWGDAVRDGCGGIDRKAVAGKVFADPAELDWLNRLVHPHVKREIARVAGQEDSLLFCAIPLLFEVGWASGMAATVAVWCDVRTQRARLRERGWSDAETGRRTGAQLPMDDKLRMADFGLINTGSHTYLHLQVRELINRLGR
jgi:dephospho-CoA kinase